jgi:tRNA (mo5U34)-methyltransferase
MTAAHRESLLARVREYTWAHSIDLGNGVVTPGLWGPPNPALLEAYGRIDFRGKRVLDIGCWDGLWSFEAEKRGAATVYATDVVSQRSFPEQPTFELARELLDSRVRYFPHTSVYDVGTLGVDDFDVVVFSGVYYHLKHPLLALAALRRVMAPGGMLIVEGPVIDNVTDSFAVFYYRDLFADDVSNWWVPTRRCLHEWIECSYFDLVQETIVPAAASPGLVPRLVERVRTMYPRSAVAHVRPEAGEVPRCVITARAVCREDKVYELPDAELSVFNVPPGGAGLSPSM